MMETEKIEQYLEENAAEFDRLVEAGESKRRGRVVRWTGALTLVAAACVALVLWLVPARPSSDNALTPLQIAEGIQQMMLLDIGDIESIVVTPAGSYAILTASLKDGDTCSYILKFNEELGAPMLLAYNNE